MIYLFAEKMIIPQAVIFGKVRLTRLPYFKWDASRKIDVFM